MKQFLSVFAALTFWFCCTTSQASTVLTGKVVKVVDGDTIKVKVIGKNRVPIRSSEVEDGLNDAEPGFAPESDYRTDVELGQVVKIRLVGIDAPESYKSKKLWRDARRCGVSPKEMSKLGKAASRVAKKLMQGKRVTVRITGHDRYGRLLGVVTVDELNVNEALLTRGVACVWRWAWPEILRLRLERKEAAARNVGMGLWGEYPEVMECLCK